MFRNEIKSACIEYNQELSTNIPIGAIACSSIESILRDEFPNHGQTRPIAESPLGFAKPSIYE